MSKNITLVIAVLTVSLAISACTKTRRVAAEQPPAYQPTPESTPIQMPVTTKPKLPEVEEAVKRVFKDAAVIDPNYESSILAGDFNGDHSQDLVVVLKPAPGKLAEMNEEYPSWLLRDPRADSSRRAPLRVEKDEPLLAVIHGYGANDWRDPQATQTFLLKNVVGSDMRIQNAKDFIAANSGRKLPRPQGDLIGETLQGTPGYLYYAVSTYSWYDPKTFKGQPEPAGVFHGSSALRR